jgi:hypothetical protein
MKSSTFAVKGDSGAGFQVSGFRFQVYKTSGCFEKVIPQKTNVVNLKPETRNLKPEPSIPIKSFFNEILIRLCPMYAVFGAICNVCTERL